MLVKHKLTQETFFVYGYTLTNHSDPAFPEVHIGAVINLQSGRRYLCRNKAYECVKLFGHELDEVKEVGPVICAPSEEINDRIA